MNQEVTIEDVMKLGSRLSKQVLASVTVKDLDENVRKQVTKYTRNQKNRFRVYFCAGTPTYPLP